MSNPAATTRTVPIDTLNLLPGNPRRGDLTAIEQSLQRFGQRYPIVVRDGQVIAGNHRLQAATNLGWSDIVVVDADDLTEDEAKAFALADNRTGDLGDYDDTALLAFLDSIDDQDLLAAASYADTFDDLLNGSELDGSSQLGALLFQVLIDCENEADQRRLIEQFTGDGYTVRAITT